MRRGGFLGAPPMLTKEGGFLTYITNTCLTVLIWVHLGTFKPL